MDLEEHLRKFIEREKESIKLLRKLRKFESTDWDSGYVEGVEVMLSDLEFELNEFKGIEFKMTDTHKNILKSVVDGYLNY